MTNEDTQLVVDGASSDLIRPQPRTPIHLRPAVERDFAFIDGLQKQHTKMLGFMHRETLEGYIAAGDVLIAETPPPCGANGQPIPGVRGNPLGYCIGRDRYFKREDVGIIYQVVVGPAKRRSLIGAMLVQSMIERAAYGCKLFCGWCAQDLDAGYFWESLGFMPLAFRTGGRSKQRVHIFWQKRIRAGDAGPGGVGGTPYWFPSQTTGGAIGEDRLVIPIPPGTHWTDAKPLVLPGEGRNTDQKALEGEDGEKPRSGRKNKKKVIAPESKSIATGGLRFETAKPPEESKPTKAKRKKRPRRKNNPEYIAAVRELRDRYLEQIESGTLALPESRGKYDVSRALESGCSTDPRNAEVAQTMRLLDAA